MNKKYFIKSKSPRTIVDPITEDTYVEPQEPIKTNTMFNNIKPTWEGSFLLLLWLSGLCLIVTLMCFVFAKKFTHRYSLGTTSGGVSITKETNWSADDEIELDRTITYSEAVRLVDSLNKTLK